MGSDLRRIVAEAVERSGAQLLGFSVEDIIASLSGLG
jgi:hypothetical protein